MCANAKIGSRTVHPGEELAVHTASGTDTKVWGMLRSDGGYLYNSRIEGLDVIWKKFGRIYCCLDCFYEGGMPFIVEGMKSIPCAGLYRDNEFTLITRPAECVVKPYHGRMPVILENPEEFIRTGIIKQINYLRVTRAA